MKDDSRRDYWEESVGDGVKVCHDLGTTYLKIHGITYTTRVCDSCGEEKVEREEFTKDYDICDHCFELEHTCCGCDKYFPDITLESDNDNDRYCEDCAEAGKGRWSE